MEKEKEKENKNKVLYIIDGYFKIQGKKEKEEEVKVSPTILLNSGRTINMLII